MATINTGTNKIILGITAEDWQREMQAGAQYYHNVGVWVAMIFDPIFGITDYINIPESWQRVFVLRLFVSLCTFGGYLLHKKGRISTYGMVAIPFALISLQNAYTYSLIGPEDILGHNLNYLALFLGASLFLLWPVTFSVIAIAFSYAATILFVSLNPQLTLHDFALEGGVLLATGAIFTIFMIQARFRLRLREVKARLALEQSLEVTDRQKKEITEQNEKLLSTTKELQQAKDKIENMNALLQDNNEMLEQQVQQRTQKLSKANHEMDQLVYSLSHDFRTPLVNVKGLINLAEYMDDSQQLKALIGKMDNSVNRFDELLRDMMNYSVYWKEELVPAEVDVIQLVNNKWKYLQYIHHNQMQLITEAGNEADWLIKSDYEKVRVLVYCLMSNAVKYNKQGGYVKVQMAHTLGNTQLLIEDNGTGIKEEHLPKVFDMFYRGSSLSSGAGMGLYIARQICEQLQGSISISSVFGQGTKVLVELPHMEK
ncbi:hypothetical protein GC194_08830 [bacterium]|nr:hypothetical protein [bacterium]